MPIMENNCSGTTENPVIRSKFSRIKLYSEYFERPAKRSSWAIGTSIGFIAYKRCQRRNKGVHLAGLIERRHHRAGIAAHHAALVGDAHRGDPFANLVDGLGKGAPPERILALLADGADVVVAFIELADQLADLFRRILQIGIQRHDILAARVGEPGHDGRMLAEVRMKQHHARFVGACLELLAQQRDRFILAAIVDVHDLVRDLQRIERGIKASKQASAAPPPRCRPESRR